MANMSTENINNANQYPVPVYAEDEISLIDLWLVLVRRKKIIVSILAISFLLGIAAALLIPKKYNYSSTIEIGTTIDNSGEATQTRLIDDPQTVLAKIQESYISLVQHDYALQNPDDDHVYGVKVRIPKNSKIIVVEAKGTEKQENIYKSLLQNIVDRVVKDHKRIMDVNRSRIDLLLMQEELKLDELQDPAYLGTKKQALEKQLTLAKVKQEELEDPRILAVPKSRLDAKLSQAKKKQVDLKDEAKFIKSKLARLDEVDKLLSKQIKDLDEQIKAALVHRQQVLKSINDEAIAMTMLMLDNEVQQNRDRLARLEERFHITQNNLREEYINNMAANLRQQSVQSKIVSEIQSEYQKITLDNTRNQQRNKPDLLKLQFDIDKLLADNKRDIIQQKQTIVDFQVQLENIRGTASIIPPIKSLKSVGISKKVLLILSLFVGLMTGVFVAFIAEFLNKAKVEIESN
ncbi:MAG: hypothetical protein GQ550_06235 [Gammaproteobacteria bacterium]|nr:hypothetical protein [Gammaproteobacteria bacterium]